MPLEIENPFQVLGFPDAAAKVRPIAASTCYNEKTVRDALLALLICSVSLEAAEGVIRRCSPADSARGVAMGRYQTTVLDFAIRTVGTPTTDLKTKFEQLAKVKDLVSAPGLPRNRAARRHPRK